MRLTQLLLCVTCLVGGACSSDSDGESSPSGGGGGGASAGSSGAAGGVVGGGCDATVGAHTGEATYYDADGSGNCSYPASANLDVAAINKTDYQGSATCGSCIELTGPKGSLTVRVVDQCPECKPGDLDLSASAFAKIAEPAKGRVPISWKFVACNTTGPVVYHFKDGSNPYWTAVQVRNHRFAIATFEVKDASGAFVSVKRESYNYFVEPKGMGPGPYTFRVTDVLGHAFTDSGIPFIENGDSTGQGQSPPCP